MFKKLSVLIISLVSSLMLAPSIFASSLSLTPTNTTIPQGSTLSVQVRLNTQGESINGVSAYLSYPADKLDVVSINYGSSAFGIAAESSYGGGGIRISRGSISGANGNVNVATIGLRGKSQGTAAVSFIGGSGAARTSNSSDSLNLSGSSGGTYTIGPPQENISSPSGQQDKTPPDITNVKVSEISTDSATITWTTNKESDSTVEYGLQQNRYILQVYDNKLTTEHKITLLGNLIAGETFHFRVKSKGSFDNEGYSNNLTFKLKGYNIKIKLIDSSNQPVPDTEVILYSIPIRSVTNQNGEVTFTDVSLGSHLVVVKLKNSTEVTKEIDVKENLTLSEFTLTIDTATSSGNNNVLLGIFYASLAILIAIAIVGMVIAKRKGNPPPMGSSL